MVVLLTTASLLTPWEWQKEVKCMAIAKFQQIYLRYGIIIPVTMLSLPIVTTWDSTVKIQTQRIRSIQKYLFR